MGSKKEDEDFTFSKTTPRNFKRVYIPTINVSDVYKHEYSESWKTYDEGQVSRFVSRHGTDKLASLSFDRRVKGSAVQKLLLKGISINGKVYSFMGCSSAGLRERTCYMWQGTREEVEELLAQEGEFEKIPTVSKQMARIGLLFSGVTLTDVEISEYDVICSTDIKRNDYVFTDGCGGVGREVAKRLFSAVINSDDVGDYLPSVYQVRFQGCKGVLALENSIPDKIRIRKSMAKFYTNRYPCIGVCKYSKPYTFGHLNKQFIMLLSGLGISDSVFKKKHGEHLHLLKTMLTDAESAITVLQWQNKFDLAQVIVKAGNIGSRPERELKAIRERLKAKIPKLTILIRESRYIFGVCDPSGILEYGECFLRITESGKQKSIRGGVVVCKTPCYLLGDVRVLKAVDNSDRSGLSQLNHLVDCIVFPIRGARPHPHEIAGSDLDGDEYFVTWDADLIPEHTRPPFHYRPFKPRCSVPVSIETKIEFFSKQNETKKMIGNINKHFDAFAEMEGVDSTECERLGQLFSRVIDAGKSGEKIPSIPEDLRSRYIDPKDGPERSVWSRMMSEADQFETNDVARHKEVTEEFVQEIAQAPCSNLCEFEKFMFVVNHIRRFFADEKQVVAYVLTNYIDYINFALFSLKEQVQAIDVGIPRDIVINALSRSKILSREELGYFRRDLAASSWGEVVAEKQASFNWRQLMTTLTSNDAVLLVMEFPEVGVLELQFIERLHEGEAQKVSPGSISAVFYSYPKKKNMKYVLGKEYYLDLTTDTDQRHRESNLQLYRERNKHKTFVMLKSKKKLDCGGTEEVKVDYIVSVDLQRFDGNIFTTDRHPGVNKKSFRLIEIYAQKKDGSASYWDSIDVNDSIAVQETVVPEPEDQNDIFADFEELFSKTGYEDLPKNGDVVPTCDALRSAAESGDPYRFGAQLQSSKEIELTEETGVALLVLMSKLVEKVVPRSLPESLQTVITEIATRMAGIRNDPQFILSLAGSLSRLHLDDIAMQVVQREFEEANLSVDSVVRVVEDWQSLWFLDTDAAKSFLQRLSRQIHQTYVESIHPEDGDSKQIHEVTEDSIPGDITYNGGDVSVYEQSQHRYIRRYGLLHALSMVSEADNQKALFCPDRESQSSMKYLQLVKTSQRESKTVSFFRSSDLGYTPRIKEGQYVAISRHRDVEEHGFKGSVTCLGQVAKLQQVPFTLTVKLSDSMPDVVSKSLSSGNLTYWRVDLIANITTYTRVVSALKYFSGVVPQDNLFFHLIHPCGQTAISAFQSDCASGKSPVARSHEDDDGIDCDDLNATQAEAVTTALQNENHVTLVQGPPGTGKTRVACHIVRLMNSIRAKTGDSSKDPTLVVAETNVAVDNLARRLRNHLLIVRAGSIDGIASDLYDISLEWRIRLIANREAKRAEFRDGQGHLHRNKQLMRRVLSSAEVVLTTCAGAGDVSLEGMKFGCVVVDEATQTMETTLLCSLAHGAKRLVMIGDPKQLGPVVPGMKVEPSERGQPFPGELGDLSKTLFHRLCNVVPTIFLDTQHRMHPEIMEFPSQEFYDGKLKAAGCLGGRSQIVFPWPEVNGKKKPLCFIDVDGKENRVGTSFCNANEIDVVQKVVDLLLSVEEGNREHRIETKDIAILTLYQGQVRELKARVGVEHGVAIRTVDGFQGQEREVVVVSTVRCNSEKVLGFSGERRRMNVLLTRAKRGLIVVGNGRTLSSSETWQRWIDQAPRLKAAELRAMTASHRGIDQRRFGGGGHSHRGGHQRGRNQRGRSQGGRNQQGRTRRAPTLEIADHIPVTPSHREGDQRRGGGGNSNHGGNQRGHSQRGRSQRGRTQQGLYR